VKRSVVVKFQLYAASGEGKFFGLRAVLLLLLLLLFFWGGALRATPFKQTVLENYILSSNLSANYLKNYPRVV